jgi:hypothetical protein
VRVRRAWWRGIREEPVLAPVLTNNRLKPDGYGAGAASRLLQGWVGGLPGGRVNACRVGVAAKDYGVAAVEGRRQIAGCLLHRANSE